MAEYRWNVKDFAAGYDAAAKHIHPHYLELQQLLLDLLPEVIDHDYLVVDVGGGSGRLAERILQRHDQVRVVVVDQSAAFLEIARRRLAPFGDRALCLERRLQDAWDVDLPVAPTAIVSMSAIHHLVPTEKQSLYRRCASCLAPGGILLNADEVRPPDDGDYLAAVRAWADHMHRVIAQGLVSEPMCDALLQWEQRNVTEFGGPRRSGDDCHETIDVQTRYYLESGFSTADVPWQRDMWAILRGSKAA